ncbi:hypothetical protein ACTPEF_27485, partial [Clostridioides difficile]
KNIYEQLERYDITVDKVSYLTKSNSEFEISIEKKTCHDGCMCNCLHKGYVHPLTLLKLL